MSEKLGHKPATVFFEKGSDDKWEVDYVDPHDGYLFIRDSDRGVHYLPWHAVRGVMRHD